MGFLLVIWNKPLSSKIWRSFLQNKHYRNFNRTVETMSLFRNLNTFKQDQVLSVQNAKPGIAHKLMLP